MKKEGVGVMNLLEFNASIPKNYYFCIGNDWKAGSIDASNIAAQYSGQMGNMSIGGLPDNVNLQDVMLGNIDRNMLEGLIDEKDLPEGVSMDDIMSMMGQTGQGNLSNAVNESMPTGTEIRNALEGSGMSKKEIDEYMKTYYPTLDNKNQANAAQTKSSNSGVKPPQCTSQWTDTTPSLELAAGNDQGVITISNEQASSTSVSINQLGESESTAINRSLEVTDDGIWAAFDQLLEETQGMSEAESAEYIMQYNNGLLSTAEVGLITGNLIERAVATCMICPTSINYNNTGMLFLCKDDTDNALKYCKVAENMDPENVSVLLNISQCYFDKGDYNSSRRYAERSAVLEPDYGLSFQMLTSINLKEGNYVKAVENLFKCTATYFSEVTASQYYSLFNAILRFPVMACEDIDLKALYDQIFSQKNLELLTIATNAGFTSNEQAIPANNKSFPWLFVNSTVKSTYKSLGAQMERNEVSQANLSRRMEELSETYPIINAYGAMGLQNMQAESESFQNLMNSLDPLTSDIELPSLSGLDNYGMISQMAKKGANGIVLLDARQYWCLQIWKAYYETLYSYWDGGWVCSGKNKFYVPDAYTSYMTERDKIEDASDLEMKEYVSCMSVCGDNYTKCMEYAETERAQLECHINELRCNLVCNKKYFNVIESNMTKRLDADKNYYETYLSPILEDYWRKACEVSAHCTDVHLQEYLLNDVMDFINWRWQSHLDDGKLTGELLSTRWEQLILNLQEEIGEAQTLLESMPADPPKPLAIKKDVVLKEYGVKDLGFDLGAGISTPLGRLSFSRVDNNYKIQFENDATGKTSGYNFTKEESYTSTTYETLADNPGSQDPKGYINSIAEWRAKKRTEEMVDMVGSSWSIKKASKFIPHAKDSFRRERIRTVDSKGNITDNGTAKFRKKEYGVGDVGVSLGTSQTRSGNVIRTKNHLGASFKFFDISIAK